MRRLLLIVWVSVLPFTSCNSSDSDNSAVRPPTGGEIEKVGLRVAYPNLSFDLPLFFGHAGDGSGRVFVVEQRGRILVFDSSRTTSTVDTFLNIIDRVNKEGWEEGLLGLAFHPEFRSNGYFYVNYTAAGPRRTVISRFRVTPPTTNQVDRNTEEVILTFEQPYANHNGGHLEFGPDGHLYIATGDGGSGGDPHNNGQSLKTLLGKILRIDVHSTSGGKAYGIPADNPFASNSEGNREEIYAYGLRNPWRFSFDSETGTMWAADVGQNQIEEVDIIEKGKNYGWSIVEGTNCYKPGDGCDSSGTVLPVWEYDHSKGQSITGGYVYRGNAVPALRGAYVFADFMSGRMWALWNDGTSPRVVELPDTDLSISSFGLDAHDELYLTAFDGKVYQVVSTAE